MYTIGFATEFYTLWTVETETIYFTDSYGKSWPHREKINFFYIKNISKDLQKVQELYPNVLIDEGLRGKVRSFSEWAKTEDLTPNILKFGKYAGKSLEEIAKIDFNYTLWLVDNAFNYIKDEVKKLPEVIEHFAKLAKIEEEKINSYKEIQSGLNTLTFINNPNHRISSSFPLPDEFKEYNNYYFIQTKITEDHSIFVLLTDSEVGYVNGLYPYHTAIINGKSKKTKNKEFSLNIEVIHTDKNKWRCHQYAIIKK